MKLHERFSTLSPIYRGGLTNHLPMMITALRMLDVEDKDIEIIAETYLKERHIVDLSNSGIENDQFNDEYIRLTNFYLNEIKHSSVEDVLSKALTDNKFSLHSGLFHGLIRIAYAYMEGTELLIAQGLAYFSLIAQEVILEGDAKEDLHASFNTLIDTRKEIDLDVDGTMSKIKVLLQNDDIVKNLFIPVNILSHKEDALAFFVDYYNKTKDFYILHVITGYHALHVLSQFFDDEEEVYNNFFRQALLVMLIFPHNAYRKNVIELESFPTLTKKVFTLSDAHDIKLFLSLAYFYEKYEMDSLIESVNMIFQK